MTDAAFPFQVEAGLLCASKRLYGLHDEMGVGKTPAICVAMDTLLVQRGIIVCPANLRTHWEEHIKRFSRLGLRVVRGQDIHDYMLWKRGRANILVASYELATKWSRDILETMEVLDFVALDEAHFIKNTSAQRTQAITGPKNDGVNSLVQWAAHVWHITGTPMANDPLDIYPFLKLMRAIDGVSETQFIKYFFYKHKTKFGSRQSPRPEKVQELKDLIHNNSIRRTSEDVGLQLPPIFLTSLLVDGDTQHVADMLKAYPGLEEAIINAVNMGGLRFLDAPHIMTLRRLVGEAKAIPYGHILVEELQGGGEKYVVIALHIDAMFHLRNFLWGSGIKAQVVYGGTNDKESKAIEDQFQHGDLQVVIWQLKKAIGVTLTAACHVDLLEIDWSPGNNAQAIKRVHRLTQKRTVRARFITLARSIDEPVNRIVADKTAAIARIEGEPMQSAPLDVLAQFV
jgi:SWI/SNF-related matrix-associated actin-dependent regulator 1 of chromatin subfamily A